MNKDSESTLELKQQISELQKRIEKLASATDNLSDNSIEVDNNHLKRIETLEASVEQLYKTHPFGEYYKDWIERIEKLETLNKQCMDANSLAEINALFEKLATQYLLLTQAYKVMRDRLDCLEKQDTGRYRDRS